VNVNNLFFLGTSFSALTWFAISSYTETPSAPKADELFTMEQEFIPKDSIKDKKTPKKPKKTTKPSFKPQDRQGDEFSNPSGKTPLILGKPSNIKTDVTLDSSMKNYTIRETVGGVDYRPPSTMTYEEYQDYKNKEAIRNNWNAKTSGQNAVQSTKKSSNALRLPVRGLNGPFGGDFVEIKPNGLVTLDFAGKWQKVNNPNIPIRQQRNGNFDFDQQISMNVVGKIGEKLKITSNWDTKATFDFQNNVKLEYTGFQEDIIQKIEAGTVSMPLNSTLISGAQNLFGVKAKLQFGRFSITGIMASQRGKVEEMTIQGGAQARDFEIKMDGYDLYRHFFLGQFFREKYESSLQSLPMVNSGVKITRVEVYMTNRINNTTTLRDMIAYLDLGENQPMHTSLKIGNTPTRDSTANASNHLFKMVSAGDYRDPITVESKLSDSSLARGTDYEIIDRARKLLPTEYTFNADLGYISLVTPLRPDEVLAVAYEYTYNGVAHKVGELNGDYNGVGGDSLIVLKMLKPSTVKNHLPTWDLMMKNIYQMPASQVTKDNFQMRVIYKNDLSGADLPNLQEGEHAKDVPLVRLMGLDRLNPNNDPPGDGNFDYIDGITIDSKTGRIIFPVLEPLGAHLIDTNNTFGYIHPIKEIPLVRKYAFTELYDSTQSDAMQVAAKNKYFIRGKYQASNSNEIMLSGINIAHGSVTVLAGSTPLVPNVDYTVDEQMGKIKILNEGVLNSGKEIKIRFEKQDLFNFRRKSFMGTRMEYKIGKNFLIGATILHQQEAPQITRVSIGDEPTNNTIWGADISYQKESRFITRMVDKLPIIQTKAPSSINFSGEFAQLRPGHAKVIDKNTNGTSFIDDFEGAETPYDFTRVPVKWRLAATPKRFGESDSSGLDYNFRRAKLAWYSIDNQFYNQTGRPKQITDDEINNHHVRFVSQQEVFPNRDRQIVATNEPTLDLAYFPAERGPYNYSTNMDPNGNLLNPSRNWGAMTREIRNDIDFDNANIQYIEFWMMDPYLKDTDNPTNGAKLKKLPLSGDTASNKVVSLSNTGQLFFNLGSISEDVMKDNRHEYENGLPLGDTTGGVVLRTKWGLAPAQPFVTNAFDISGGARDKQDVGLDGLKNNEEAGYFSAYKAKLDNMLSLGQLTQVVYNDILSDISSDDFKYFLGDAADNADLSVLQRYKSYNGMENNSPTSSVGAYTPSSSSLPDNEDLNGDNTINDIEEYYEYKINIDPNQFIVGQNNIVSKETSTVNGDAVTWYQFRIPIRVPDSIVGNISSFKSIKFFRAYMTGFKEPVLLRLAQFQLVSSQWRVYNFDINDGGAGTDNEPPNLSIVVSTINIEENGQGSPTSAPYVLPPGFYRDRDVGAQNNRRLNEQSLKVCVNNLPDGMAKGVYKNVNLNLLNYGKVRMFLHAESAENTITYTDGSMHAFMRIGTDFTDNYYEIEVPLYFTSPRNSTDPNSIWRSENEIVVATKDLTAVKVMRNQSGSSYTLDFITTYNGRIIRVKGNPDLSAVQSLMIGIRNPKDANKSAQSVCIWADELRMTDFVEQSGWATASKLNIKLADLGTINASLRYVTPGFGALDQKVSQRANNFTTEWGVSSNLSLDKFIPAKLGIKLPMYISYDRSTIAPKYNPLDPDVLLKTSLNSMVPGNRKAYREFTVDDTRRRSLNFTNIQKVKIKKDAKHHIYDIENLSLTTAYSETQRHNINLKDYNQKFYKVALGYSFSNSPKNHEPFKKISWLKSPYLKLIREINFTLLPSSITFRTDVDRKLTKTQYFEGKPLEGGIQDPLFEKSFIFTRNYGLLWNFTKSISLDYTGVASGVIDEPSRDPSIRHQEYKDSIIHNLKTLGRVKNYNQTIGVNYKVPLDKLPFTDWLSADTRYAAGYTWTSGALFIRDTIGNVIQNTRDMKLTGKINMDKLYNKLKFLNAINNPPPPKPKGPPTKKDTSQTLPKPELKGLKAILKSLMSIKSINFNYNVNQGLSLAGYLPKANYFGVDKHQDPTEILPFILGSQNTDIRYQMAGNHQITDRRSLNTPFTRMRNVTYTAQTSMEPVKDFKIQIDAQKATTSKYSELFRINPAHLVDPTVTDYVSESPTSNGSVTMSYIAIGTAFKHTPKSSKNPNASSTFQRMESNRVIIKGRMNNPDFYNQNSQEVLIPSFLAAYTGRDAQKQHLSAFPALPLPNWNVNFTGLTRIKKLAKLFPSFAITHVYTCTYTVNYNSNLAYGSNVIKANEDPTVNTPQPTLRSDTGVYKPVYVIDQLTILEKFAPLLGVDFKTKGKLTGKLYYTRSRNLTMSVSNASITELRTSGLVFGLGLTKTGFKIPFSGRVPVVLKNELQVRIDVTVNDTKTILRNIDGVNTVTAGNLNFQLKPTINYMVNTRVTIQFYFDRQINAPKISSSYRRATTAFGLQIRFTLS
jgi:cell surface protein SprA